MKPQTIFVVETPDGPIATFSKRSDAEGLAGMSGLRAINEVLLFNSISEYQRNVQYKEAVKIIEALSDEEFELVCELVAKSRKGRDR